MTSCTHARRRKRMHRSVHACSSAYIRAFGLCTQAQWAYMRASTLCTHVHWGTCMHRPCARRLVGVHACFGPVHACSSAYMRASTLCTQAHWRACVLWACACVLIGVHARIDLVHASSLACMGASAYSRMLISMHACTRFVLACSSTHMCAQGS